MSDKDKKKLQVILFAGLLALVGMGYWWMFFVRKELDQARVSQEELTTQIASAQQRWQEIQLFDEKRDEILARKKLIDKAAERLPKTKDAQGFLNNLQDIMRQSNVIGSRILSMPPQENSLYTEIPWKITGNGRYSEIGRFINMIELNPDRFLRIKTISVVNDNTLPIYHPINVEISTFMFNK